MFHLNLNYHYFPMNLNYHLSHHYPQYLQYPPCLMNLNFLKNLLNLQYPLYR
jgi:hypothetical protein